MIDVYCIDGDLMYNFAKLYKYIWITFHSRNNCRKGLNQHYLLLDDNGVSELSQSRQSAFCFSLIAQKHSIFLSLLKSVRSSQDGGTPVSDSHEFEPLWSA